MVTQNPMLYKAYLSSVGNVNLKGFLYNVEGSIPDNAGQNTRCF